MLMALGVFVFQLSTLSYQEMQHQTDWRHAGHSRIGARDALQYLGQGDETITLSGWVVPELSEAAASLVVIKGMADSGRAWALIEGTGRVLGAFVITSLNETRSILESNGHARRIDFTLSLKRQDAPLGQWNRLLPLTQLLAG
jgi:uncharacterized protein